MRILIVSHYFPPEPMRVGDLALGLKDLGNKVQVLTGFPGYPHGTNYPGYGTRIFRREDYHGVDVIRVPLYANYSKSKFRRALNYLSFVISGSLLGPALVNSPDRILVYQNSPATMAIPAFVVKELRGGRLFLWVQDLWPETLEALGVTHNRLILQSLDLLVRFLYGRCEKVLVQSRAFASAIAGRGIAEDRIEYVPNWAEDDYRVQSSDQEFLRTENLDDGFKVMFAGNIGIAQNLPLLLDAAELLREQSEIRFIVIGDGSEFRVVLESARRRGLQNVTFKGRQPVKKMPQYFAAADALLIQLKMNRALGMTIPSKLQSYMACGRPIIAALCGTAAEAVDEARAGIVCRPDDPEALRDGVLRLWKMSSEERRQMGMNARRYYEAHFDRRLILNRLQNILT